MEQYKVILVDDEVEVIDVMKKKIRWDDLGFDVVGRDRKSTRLNSSHDRQSRMPSSA